MFLVPSAAPQNLTLEVRNSKVSWENFLLVVGKRKAWCLISQNIELLFPAMLLFSCLCTRGPAGGYLNVGCEALETPVQLRTMHNRVQQGQ